MVSLQKASWILALPSNDAGSVGTVESNEMVKRKGNLGKLDFLDRDFHWSQSFMQSLLDYLISRLVYRLALLKRVAPIIASCGGC